MGSITTHGNGKKCECYNWELQKMVLFPYVYLVYTYSSYKPNSHSFLKWKRRPFSTLANKQKSISRQKVQKYEFRYCYIVIRYTDS